MFYPVNYDWILFDADNTLFDFHASSELAFFAAFKQVGISATKEHYQAFQQINQQTWQAFDLNQLDHESIKRIRFERLFDAYKIDGLDPLDFNALYFDQLICHARFIEGAPEILKQLHGQIRLGVITNGMKEVQRPRLEYCGWTGYFDVIVVSGEIGHSKPDRAFFDVAASQMDIGAPDRILVVGDNLYADIKGGNDFGFHTAWFNPSGQEMENGVRPHYEISRLTDLYSILLNG